MKDYPPANPYRSRAILGLLALGAVLVTLVVHWPALSTRATCFDDERYLAGNPLLEKPGWRSVAGVFGEVLEPSTVIGYYHPLSILSLALDCAMGGRLDNPEPFHRTSLLLHLASTGLLMVLLYQLFGHPWAAIGVGLLFGIHPLTVEPVAWITARRGLLAGALGLGCLVLYARFVRRRGWGCYAACLLVYGLALLSRPSSVPLPLLMLVLDYWPLRRLDRRALIEKVPFLVLGAVFGAVAVISHARTAQLVVLPDHSIMRLMLVAVYKPMFYLGKIVWPANLSAYYAAPAPLDLTNPMVLLAVAGACVLVAIVIVSLRWTRALLASLAFFFLALAPVLDFFGHTDWVFACDNYVYLPAVGVLMAVAAGLKWVLGRVAGLPRPFWPRMALVLAIAGAGLAEAMASRCYLACWRDSETLFQHMLRLEPRSARLLDCMGLALQRQGRLPEAVDYCTRAIKADPTAAYLYSDLGVTYVMQDRLPEAVEQFRRATQLDPAFLDGYSNLGHALLKLNQPGEAIAVFRRALELKPGHPRADLGLAMGLAMEGRTDEAMRLYRQTLRHQRPAASVHGDMGDILIKKGRPTEAIECYGQAWQLEPDSPRVLNNLSWLLATSKGVEQPRREEAVVLAEELVRRVGRTEPEPLDTLAAAYAAVGRYPEAAQTEQRAIELALASRKGDLAREMQLRLDGYKAGRPHREPAVPPSPPAERPSSP